MSICAAAIGIAVASVGIFLWARGARLVPADSIPSASAMVCLAVPGAGVLCPMTGRAKLAAIIASFILAVSTDTLISSVSVAPLRVDKWFVGALIAAGLP